MGFRFRKSVKLMPGVRLNIGARGISTTIGARGCSVNLSSRGAYLNTGIPGTGISHRERVGGSSRARAPQPAPTDALPASPARAVAYQIPVVPSPLAQPQRAPVRDSEAGHLQSLINILKTRERADYVWREVFSPVRLERPRFAAPAFAFDPIAAHAAATGETPLWPLGILAVLAAGATTAPNAALVGYALLVVAAVGAIMLVRRRGSLVRRARAEALRAHDLLVAGDAEQHERNLRALDEIEAEANDHRGQILEALEEGDLQTYADVLFAEFADEILPVSMRLRAEISEAAVSIEIHLPEPEVIPPDIPDRTPTGRAKRTAFKKSERKALYLQVCCALMLRMTHETLRVLPPIQRVTISGVISRADPSTGHDRHEVVMHLETERMAFTRLDLDRAEPIPAFVTLGGVVHQERDGNLGWLPQFIALDAIDQIESGEV